MTNGQLVFHKLKGKHEWGEMKWEEVDEDFSRPYKICKICGYKTTAIEEDVNRIITGSGTFYTTHS